MNLDPAIFWISLLSGALALDVTVAVQSMVSRPLACGFLVGWLMGDIPGGLKIGCLLELFWSGSLAVGAFVPPDFQVGSVFAVAASLLLRRQLPNLPDEAVAGICLAMAIPLAFFSGMLEVVLRGLNVRLAHWIDAGVSQGNESPLKAAVAASLVMYFVKGVAVTGLSLILLLPLLHSALQALPPSGLTALIVVYWMAWAIGFAVVLDLFWSKDTWAFLLVTFGTAWILAYVVALPTLWLFALAMAGGSALSLAFSRPE